MKKLVTMLLAVTLVVSLAGVVMAETSCCPDFLPKFDTLRVNYEVVPLTGIEICTEDVSLCTYIGCTQDMWSVAKSFNYKAIATGSCMRKIVGSIQSTLPAEIALWAHLGRPASRGTSTGPKELSTSDVDLVKDINKLCLSNGTGKVALAVTPDACAATGCVVMQLTIMDQGV